MDLTAHSIPKRRQAKSLALESLIGAVAMVSVLIGVVAAVAVLIFFGFPAIVTSLSILVGSLLNWLFLQSLAEIIRLLKKIAKITMPGLSPAVTWKWSPPAAFATPRFATTFTAINVVPG